MSAATDLARIVLDTARDHGSPLTPRGAEVIAVSILDNRNSVRARNVEGLSWVIARTSRCDEATVGDAVSAHVASAVLRCLATVGAHQGS